MLENTGLDKAFLRAVETIAEELTLIRMNTDKLLEGRAHMPGSATSNVESLLFGLRDAFAKMNSNKVNKSKE